MGAAVQENFKETDDAWVVDLDAGIANRADGDRESEALQERFEAFSLSLHPDTA